MLNALVRAQAPLDTGNDPLAPQAELMRLRRFHRTRQAVPRASQSELLTHRDRGIGLADRQWGAVVDGAPAPGADTGSAIPAIAKFVAHDSASFLEFFSPGETAKDVAWRWWAAPWVPGDSNESLKSPDGNPSDFVGLGKGVLPRFNGSPFYPTKTPDLIGLKDRKYIDHTATHLLRGPEDLMRYAALVSCCDSADFGKFHMLTKNGRRVVYRFPDELLYALAQYIYSLQPPPNPNLGDPRGAAGRKIFEREGCGNCHTAPLYTNNKLTIAEASHLLQSIRCARTFCRCPLELIRGWRLKPAREPVYTRSLRFAVSGIVVSAAMTVQSRLWSSGSTPLAYTTTTRRLGSKASR